MNKLPLQYQVMRQFGVIRNPEKIDYLLKLNALVEKYELNKKSRHRELVQIRHYFHWFVYSNFCNKLRLIQIGKLTGKDHATVLNSIRVVNDLLSVKDELFLNLIKDIELELNRTSIELQGKVIRNAKSEMDKNKNRNNSRFA